MRMDRHDWGSRPSLVQGVTADSPALRGEGHRPMRELLAYWEARRQGRAMPRAALDPVQIPGLLANLFLVDRAPGARFDVVFRLLGTRIVEVEGELKGRRLSELIPRGSRTEMLWEHYERALAGEVCLRQDTLRWQGRGFVAYDVLLLAMTRSGAGIDAALGMALYAQARTGP